MGLRSTGPVGISFAVVCCTCSGTTNEQRGQEKPYNQIDDGTSGAETGGFTNRKPARWTGMWRAKRSVVRMDGHERESHIVRAV